MTPSNQEAAREKKKGHRWGKIVIDHDRGGQSVYKVCYNCLRSYEDRFEPCVKRDLSRIAKKDTTDE